MVSEGPACRVRRATFDHRFSSPGHDKRAPPIFGKPFAPEHPSAEPACQVRSFDIGSSIAFRRGLKSRAESGAKAPHSIWSAAINRRFSVKALAFTILALSRVFPDHETCPPVGAIHEWPLPRWCLRDPLVGSVAPRSIIDSLPPGTTSVPLRFLENLSRRNIPRRDVLVTSAFGGTCIWSDPLVGSVV